jgi:hypothetical protein
MAYKLIQIDRLTRGDHSYLTPIDRCHHIMVYHPRKGYAYGEENDILQNFKKPMDRKGNPEWWYKGWAINKIAEILRNIVTAESLDGWTVVPIPPSKVKTDPLYDDRVQQVLAKFSRGYGSDIRELLYLTENYQSSHETDERLKPKDFENLYKVDMSLRNPKPKKILLFDDMITAGSHYVGCKNLLAAKFPEASISGLFIFRRVPEEG